MRSNPRDVFLAMKKRWDDESPEAVYEEKRASDEEVRSSVHKMVKARFAEQERRLQTEAARSSPNAGKPKMFRDSKPPINVVISDRLDENEGNVSSEV